MLVSLREMLEMYGIAATGDMLQAKVGEAAMRSLLTLSPEFAEVRPAQRHAHVTAGCLASAARKAVLGTERLCCRMAPAHATVQPLAEHVRCQPLSTRLHTPSLAAVDEMPQMETPDICRQQSFSSVQNQQFKERLEGMLQRGATHPKMSKLQEILLGHFRGLAGAEGARPVRGKPQNSSFEATCYHQLTSCPWAGQLVPVH